ncbi:hypothetical protein [Halomontanus rarus]|uniref:hypothetical protein n=1 Tax=Halomontanus rarus TaxID=3034020 RepID=UPI0023E7FF2F|nr:hypothetical protein [Halovivax sp. TS33]
MGINTNWSGSDRSPATEDESSRAEGFFSSDADEPTLLAPAASVPCFVALSEE